MLDGIEVNFYDALDPNFGKAEFDAAVADFLAQEQSGTGDTAVKQVIVPLFWVYYPMREILKKGQAFNNRNTSKYISFDDIINSRRFSSVIYKRKMYMRIGK